MTNAYEDAPQGGEGEQPEQESQHDEEQQFVVRKVPDLPASLSELTPKVRRLPNINDQVHSVFDRLFEEKTERGAEFHRCLNATNDAGAVHGSMIADDFGASIKILEAAEQWGSYDLIDAANWAEVRLALRVVMRRWGIAREQRRNLLGDEIVPNGDDE